MLKQEDNELITRVGPGTPMGNLMREYWVPAMLSSELPGPDCDPVRVLLLGEQLIALPRHQRQGRPARRTTARTAARRCSSAATKRPACAASTTAGSSTSTGNCIDMPNEPAESRLQDQGQGRRVPVPGARRHRLGLHGPAHRRRRRCPTSKATCCRDADGVRAFQLRVQLAPDPRRRHRHHPRRLPALRRPEGRRPAAGQLLGVPAARQDRPLRGDRHRGRRGVRRAPRRPAEDQDYWRIAQFCFPFYTFTPPGVLGTKKGGGARVPMDDHHTMNFFMTSARSRPGQPVRIGASSPTACRTRPTGIGRFRLEQQPRQRLPDRPRRCSARTAARRATPGISGIAHAGRGDDRQHGRRSTTARKEHLGTTDAMVIRVRRRLIAAVQAHMRARHHPARRRRSRGLPRALRRRLPARTAPTGSRPRASCARRSSSTPSWTRRSTARCKKSAIS